MITFYLIFTAFAVTTVAKAPLECSFEDTAGIRQCHGVEGQQLIFHLSNRTNTEIKLKKDGTFRILIDRNGSVLLYDRYVNQFEQIQTGKFKLVKATKQHSGEYQLDEHNITDGKMIKTVKVRLNIHTPVSKPAVSQTCLSLDSSAVTCSSEGDEVEFLLTLNGHLLMQTKDHSQLLSDSTDDNSNNVPTVSMNIHGQLTGNLLCQVGNKVSRNETSFHLTVCKGFKALTVPLLAGTATIFLFVTLGLIVSYLYKKPISPPDIEDNCEEVIYTGVKVTKNK